MKNRPHNQTRRCAHCGQAFVIDPRVGSRHRFCPKPECHRASHSIAQKKWLQKNGGKDYFSGATSLSRVRDWRQKHPQYWRKKTDQENGVSGAIISKKLATVLRYVALQDTIDTNLALKIGIVSHLTGSALQDTIAKEIRRLMLRGHAILRGEVPRL